jgi:hypothetical protein
MFSKRPWPIHPHWLLLAALPIGLLTLNDSWAFTPPGIDSWIYYGYFYHLSDFLKAYPDTYFGSRLAWILPGYLLHQTLPPLAANYALRIGLYWVTLGAFYGTTMRLWGRKPALLGSLLMGSYLPFMAALGWNYIDGAGIAYTTLTLYCLTYAAQEKNAWMAWLGAGMTFGLALHTNLFLAVLAPPLALYSLGLNALAARYSWLKIICFVALGALLVTVFLGLLTYAINGNLWFFMPSVRYSQASAEEAAGNLVVADGWEWLLEARHLILYGVALLGAVIAVFKRGHDLLVQLTWVSAALIFIVLQWRDAPALLLPPYATYLLPLAFWGVTGQLFAPLKAVSNRTLAIILSLWGGGVALALISPDLRNLLAFEQPVKSILAPLLVLWICYSASFLKPTWALPLLGLALTFVGLRTLAWQPVSNPVTRFEGQDRDLQLAIAESLQQLDSISATPHFWFSNQPPQTYEWFYSLASAYIPPYTFVSPAFPGIYPQTSLGQGERWVVLAPGDELTAEAILTLQNRRIQPRIVAQIPIQQGQVAYQMTVLELGPCGSEPTDWEALALPSIPDSALIFYPASDLEAQRADLTIQFDCLVDEDEKSQHALLFKALAISLPESEINRATGHLAGLGDWRASKAPADLLQNGVEYILVSSQWLAGLSQADYDRLYDRQQYELVLSWELRRAETQYYLFRALATSAQP